MQIIIERPFVIKNALQDINEARKNDLKKYQKSTRKMFLSFLIGFFRSNFYIFEY